MTDDVHDMVDDELLDENLSGRKKLLHIAEQLANLHTAESFAYWNGEVAAEVIREYLDEPEGA